MGRRKLNTLLDFLPPSNRTAQRRQQEMLRARANVVQTERFNYLKELIDTHISTNSSLPSNEQDSTHSLKTDHHVNYNDLSSNLNVPVGDDQEWIDIEDKNSEDANVETKIKDVINDYLSTSTTNKASDRFFRSRSNYHRLYFSKSKDLHFFTTFEIAVLLVFLRQRHRLSHSCLNSICRLLHLLRVKTAPINSNSIKNVILQRTTQFFFSKKEIICPSCHEVSENSHHCPSPSCKSQYKYERMPTTNLTFQIEPQICSILARHPNLLTSSTDLNRVSDIVDSSSYRHIAEQESSPFITLLMNSDGVLLKKISYSIWITCFAINELPASVRFDPENIIVAMVSHSSAKAKLKRKEMQILLNKLVDQLIILEREGVTITENNIHDNSVESISELKEKSYKVFLYGGVCDKPATAMLTNMVECTGYYGCNLCTTEGIDIASGQGHVRSYVFLPDEQSTERTNQTHDFAVKNLRKMTLKTTNHNSGTDHFLGHKGPCALRRLKYFDVCQGFLVDSLHSLYAGCFKRLVSIELADKQIQKKITEVFDTIHYPSSSYRIPRSLSYLKVYKGNEYRMALLFGYR
ncbi:unnamed protein product [Rotaria sp. Silwood1]|nr:unnamed protein product [Rotaria sp. Silwood1]